MELDEYQRQAQETDQNPAKGDLVTKAQIIPLLGMAGEVGTLLAEYKKLLRDGPVHLKIREHVAEELGDILWYVANVATKFDLSLGRVASDNLVKTKDRWIRTRSRILFDESHPPAEQLPRQFEYTFAYRIVDGAEKVVLLDADGNQVGNALSDNAYREDGYRFHDAFHLANAAVLGWSPVIRKLLGCKRKTEPKVDEVEDGGRATVIEEGLVASIYEYGVRHDLLRGAAAVDWELLRGCKRLTANLEVRLRTAGEWELAILSGFRVFRELCEHDGGTVRGDLEAGTIEFLGR